ncbi:MAG: bifunctional nuclease family protein [Spirochaetes bacterium]|nr:bifunctional nuclease family protein [Spirochaetota bacterium]
MAANTFVEAEIWTLAQTEQGNVVLVRPKNSELVVPIFIGQLETQAILIGLGQVEMPRPLTHDLILSVMEKLGGRLQRIEIHDLKEGTFFARLILDHEGRELIIDSRPSDAMSLAVRTGCPVFIAEDIVEEAGISVNLVTDAADRGEKAQGGVNMGRLPFQNPESGASEERLRLESELTEAVAEEDYERAAVIRDRIKALGS